MDSSQQIKAQLVILAHYLQCQPLSDEQVLLYARELEDIGPEGLARAISALKADDSVWSGRFPLPAKIRSYLHGSVEDRAARSATKILALSSVGEAYATLSREELAAAKKYGLSAIVDRSTNQTPTIYAQLRDLLQADYREVSRRQSTHLLPEGGTLGLPNYSQEADEEAPRPEGLPITVGADGRIQARSVRTDKDSW